MLRNKIEFIRENTIKACDSFIEEAKLSFVAGFLHDTIEDVFDRLVQFILFSEGGRCTATTKKGRICSKKSNSSGLCGIHHNVRMRMRRSTKEPAVGGCHAATAKNVPCSRRAKVGLLCVQHSRIPINKRRVFVPNPLAAKLKMVDGQKDEGELPANQNKSAGDKLYKPYAGPPELGDCIAITKAGHQCKRRAHKNNLCSQHIRCEEKRKELDAPIAINAGFLDLRNVRYTLDPRLVSRESTKKEPLSVPEDSSSRPPTNLNSKREGKKVVKVEEQPKNEWVPPRFKPTIKPPSKNIQQESSRPLNAEQSDRKNINKLSEANDVINETNEAVVNKANKKELTGWEKESRQKFRRLFLERIESKTFLPRPDVARPSKGRVITKEEMIDDSWDNDIRDGEESWYVDEYGDVRFMEDMWDEIEEEEERQRQYVGNMAASMENYVQY